jgi:hypothetical protein
MREDFSFPGAAVEQMWRWSSGWKNQQGQK